MERVDNDVFDVLPEVEQRSLRGGLVVLGEGELTRYKIGDIFRCTTSLYHLIQPEAYEGMIRALIDIYRYFPPSLSLSSLINPTNSSSAIKATCPMAAAETGTAKPKAAPTPTTYSPTPTSKTFLLLDL